MSGDTTRRRHGLPVEAAVLWLAGLAVPCCLAAASLVLARALSVEEFGKVAFFLSVYGLAIAYASFGLTARTVAGVARALASGDHQRLAACVGTTALLRVISLLPVALAAVGLLVLGHVGLGAALIAGSLALAQEFMLGAIQGLGRALLSVALKALQVAIYAVEVPLWLHHSSEEAYWAFGLSYLFPMALSALILCRHLARLGVRPTVQRAQLLPSVLQSAQTYFLGLLLSPLTSMGLVILGWTQQFQESALFSVALSCVALLPQTLTVVVTALYFPRLCGLARTGAVGEAGRWFDTFWRAFAAVGLSGAALLLVYPAPALELLFSGSYASAAPLLLRLLPLVVLLPLNSLVLWSLVANRRAGCALATAFAQFALLGGLAAAALLQSGAGLPVALADAHVAAVAVGTAVSVAALWALHGYRPSLGRLVLAGAAVLLLSRSFAETIELPDILGWRLLVMGSLGVMTTGASLALVFSREMRALLSR